MALEPWRRSDLFFQPETYFSFAIEFMKSYTNMTIGHELYIKAVDPQSFVPLIMFCASFASIAAAVLAESFVGKYFIVFIGVVFLLVSCALYLMSIVLPKVNYYLFLSSIIFLLGYISTSGVRNIFLLEQIEDFTDLRIIVFALMYTRLIWRGVTSLHLIYPIVGYYMRWAAVVAILITMVYIFLLLWIEPKVEPEREHSNITFRCIMCLLNSLIQWKSLELLKQNERQLEREAKSLRRSISLKPSELSFNPSLTARRQNTKRWSNRKSTAYQETIYFVRIFPWIILGVCMSNLLYMILVVTAAQREYETVGSNIGFTFVKLFTLLFELLLFPLLEFAVVDYTKMMREKSLFVTMIGYMILITSAITALIIQLQVSKEEPLVARLKRGTAQLNIMNFSPYAFYASSSWSGSITVMGGNGLYQNVFKIKDSSIVKELQTSEDSFQTKAITRVKLINGQCVSYYRKGNGLAALFTGRTSSILPDPTHKSKAIIRRIECAGNKTSCTIYGHFFINMTEIDSGNLKTLGLKTDTFKIKPGTYNVTGSSINSTESFPLLDKYNFRANLLYVLVISIEGEPLAPTTGKGSVIVLDLVSVNASMLNSTDNNSGNKTKSNVTSTADSEDLPVPLKSRYILLVQLFLASLGNCISTVSYYAFLFYESPPKMRPSVITLILMANLLYAGAYSYAKASTLLILLHIIFHGIVFVIYCYPVYDESWPLDESKEPG